MNMNENANNNCFYFDVEMKLQDLLLKLTDDTYEDIRKQIIDSIFAEGDERLLFLFHNIFLFISIRTKLIYLYSKLLYDIYSQSDETKKSRFSTIFQNSLKTSLLHRHQFHKYAATNFCFLYHLKRLNLIDIQYIIDNLDPILFAPYKFLRSRITSNSYQMLYLTTLVSIFGPDLKDKDFYPIYLALIEESSQFQEEGSVEVYLYEELKMFKENNWSNWEEIFVGRKIIDGSVSFVQSLILALQNDDIETLKRISDSDEFDLNGVIHPSVLEPCEFLHSDCVPIHFAIYHGSIKCLNYLLEKGADINIKSRNDLTPLHFAIMNGNTEIINIISKNTLPPFSMISYTIKFHQYALFEWMFNNYNNELEKGSDSEKPLVCISASVNALTIFKQLSGKYSVNIIDKLGWTPLHNAVESNNISIVKFLLNEKDINVNCKEAKGWAPLHRAAINGYLCPLNLLLQHKDINVNIENHSGRTPLHRAAREGHVDCLERLLSIPEINVNALDKKYRSPLHYAVLGQRLESIRLLLKHKDVKCNLLDDSNQSPLHLAVSADFSECIDLFHERPDFDINLQGQNKWTVLHAACNSSGTKCISKLIQYPEIDINPLNDYNRTPIFNCVEENNIEGVKLLISTNKADLKIKDSEGKTPKDVAIEKGLSQEMIDLL